MSNEKEKIAKGKIKPQSACKKWKSKKLGKNEKKLQDKGKFNK